MATIDMRTFAKGAGINRTLAAGSTLFNEGDPADCLYVVQSGVVEMEIHGKVVDVCGPGEAVGFMSVIDGEPRTATARIKEAAEVSMIDKKRFRFMVDEVPNFAQYIMEAMAHRIRGMRQAI